MTWTTDRPTADGYYWAIPSSPWIRRGRPTVIYVGFGGNVFDGDALVPWSRYSHFAGPIAPPLPLPDAAP